MIIRKIPPLRSLQRPRRPLVCSRRREMGARAGSFSSTIELVYDVTLQPVILRAQRTNANGTEEEGGSRCFSWNDCSSRGTQCPSWLRLLISSLRLTPDSSSSHTCVAVSYSQNNNKKNCLRFSPFIADPQNQPFHLKTLSIFISVENMRIQAVSSALLVCCFSTLGVFCRADPVQIETLYSSAPLYYGMLADFGGQLGKPDMVNLMLIRDDINLCTFPEYLRGITDEQRTRIPSAVPVGFFISRNRCSIEQKARVLLEMQKTVSDRFQYLFVFNVDSSGSDDFETFKATSKNTSDLESVSVIQLPYRQAAGIYRILDYRMRQSRLNPHLLDDGNEQWNFILNVQLSPGGFLPESLTPREINSSNFVWFRFVLFSLLILSPCCRAGYLWYASGGRIHLRRNDRGRIVGIQYIP